MALAPAAYFMPSEWSEHSACWMLWVPEGNDLWGSGVEQARKEYALVANTIHRYEPVRMGVSENSLEEAKALLDPSIDLVVMNIDDCWMRDTGPTFVKHKTTGEVAGVDWIFNGYSNKFPHQHDKYIARNVLQNQNLHRFGCPLILEGGSIHTDGEGTLLTTEECLLTRNPHLSKEDIEVQLSLHLGICKVLWIPRGVIYDVDTNGHVDNLCCFARPGEVILTYPSEESHIQRERSEEARSYLASCVDAKGRKLKIHKVEHPKLQFVNEMEANETLRNTEEPLAASYVNFYMTNGAIVMPSFENGKGNDVCAKKQLQTIFPNRIIDQISSRTILIGGGNIHCITQQQPK